MPSVTVVPRLRKYAKTRAAKSRTSNPSTRANLKPSWTGGGHEPYADAI